MSKSSLFIKNFLFFCGVSFLGSAFPLYADLQSRSGNSGVSPLNLAAPKKNLKKIPKGGVEGNLLEDTYMDTQDLFELEDGGDEGFDLVAGKGLSFTSGTGYDALEAEPAAGADGGEGAGGVVGRREGAGGVAEEAAAAEAARREAEAQVAAAAQAVAAAEAARQAAEEQEAEQAHRELLT
ncbi:MAG: hypothetical protein ACRC12_02750 [Holosporales bacterium]